MEILSIVETIPTSVTVVPPVPMMAEPAHPPRCLHGHVYPVVIVTDTCKYPRQSRLATLRSVRHEADQLRSEFFAVDDKRRSRVSGTWTSKVFANDTHFPRRHLLFAFSETVFLHRHWSEVERLGGVMSIKTPSSNPGRGSWGWREAGHLDGGDVGGVGGGGPHQLHDGDVIGQRGVAPRSPVWTPETADNKIENRF